MLWVGEAIVKSSQERPEPPSVPARHPRRMFRQQQAVIAHEGLPT